MNWLGSVTLLLIAGNFAWGFFRGLLRVVYAMAAGILILGFVTFATPYIAQWLSKNTTLQQQIEKTCEEKIRKQAKEHTSDFESRLPEAIVRQLDGTQTIADGLMENSGAYSALASEIAAFAVRAIAGIFVFLVTAVAFRLIAVAIDLVAKLPVIGEVNHFLGGIAGLAKGIFWVWLLFGVAALAAATAVGSTIIDAVYQSEWLQWLYENNPLLTLLLSFWS